MRKDWVEIKPDKEAKQSSKIYLNLMQEEIEFP